MLLGGGGEVGWGGGFGSLCLLVFVGLGLVVFGWRSGAGNGFLGGVLATGFWVGLVVVLG